MSDTRSVMHVTFIYVVTSYWFIFNERKQAKFSKNLEFVELSMQLNELWLKAIEIKMRRH